MNNGWQTKNRRIRRSRKSFMLDIDLWEKVEEKYKGEYQLSRDFIEALLKRSLEESFLL